MTGEHSEARGLCEPPQQALSWLQSLTVPAQCLRIEVVVHQSPSGGAWCCALEVSDPHSRELLGKWVEPARMALSHTPLATLVTNELRSMLLALTDPEPFWPGPASR